MNYFPQIAAYFSECNHPNYVRGLLVLHQNELFLFLFLCLLSVKHVFIMLKYNQYNSYKNQQQKKP